MTISAVDNKVVAAKKGQRLEIVTYDVEHGLITGACVVGQRAVCRTTQRFVAVFRADVPNVQVAVRHDAEAVA